MICRKRGFSRLADEAKWLHDNTDYAISCGEMIRDLQLTPGGTQSWWMRMVSEPDACHEFLGKAVDAALSQLKQLDDAVGGYCSILGMAHDMGDTRGIMIGLLDDLIECGVDIYNPVQISANNMQPTLLKERFGDKLIFYGAVYDAIQLPITAKPERVYEEVSQNIRTMNKGGGYIFAGVHNLPGDLPETHINAMLQAYRDCRYESQSSI